MVAVWILVPTDSFRFAPKAAVKAPVTVVAKRIAPDAIVAKGNSVVRVGLTAAASSTTGRGVSLSKAVAGGLASETSRKTRVRRFNRTLDPKKEDAAVVVQEKPVEVKKFTMEEIMGNEEILAKVTKTASVRIFAPSTLVAYKKWRGKYWFVFSFFFWLVRCFCSWFLFLG